MPDYTNNILLTGYWPPTNHVLRQFSTDPDQNPGGWRGRNWRGHGFDIYAFFPEFDVPDDEIGDGGIEDVGSGDFRVDYQDTRADWFWITEWLRPCAIITFSRGYPGISWEIEEWVRNLDTWVNDYIDPKQPTPAPPDPSFPADYPRSSTLPMEAISARVNNASHLDVHSYVDSGNDFAGAFLSEFIGHLGVWYQDDHSHRDADGMCFAAGHIHVGKAVSVSDATEATELTLEALIDHIKPLRPTTWISEIMFRVETADTDFAGTDQLLTVEIHRDGKHLVTGRLDYASIDDHERGDSRYYNFVLPERYHDETSPLPPGIGSIPPPYPDTGMEFSDGLAGNLACRLRIHGDDMWIKDQVDIYVKEVRLIATSSDTMVWVDDSSHRYLGSWTQDVALSWDSDEGYETWTLVY